MRLNKSTAGNAGWASRFPLEHDRPGVPESSRSGGMSFTVAMKRTLKLQIGSAATALLLGVAVISRADPLDTWTSRDSGTSHSLFGSTYGNGRFVIVGEGGTILTSADGMTWTSHSPVTSENLHDVAYGNGVFVATGGSDEETLNNALLTSPNGVTWTSRTVPAVGPIYSLTYGGGKFVALGFTQAYRDALEIDKTTILVSSDGLSWTNRGAITNVYLPDITYADGTFVAVGEDYSVPFPWRAAIFISQDGINWVQRVVPFPRMGAVTHGNDLFVVMGEEGTILTSSNGVSWTPRNSGTTNWFHAVASGGGTFVAMTRGGIFDFGRGPTLLRSSTNGIDWNTPIFAFTNAYFTISYGHGAFVVAGENGIIAQSGFIGPPILTAFGSLTAAGFPVRLIGEVGRNYLLEASTNFAATDWPLLHSFTLVQPTTNILDTAATNFSRRFYRAVSP